MPLEHIGLGVPDVDAAKEYYDEFMPMVGYQPCFGNGYCPDNFKGTQIYLYDADGLDIGLQHLAFLVPTRDQVQRVHQWAVDRGDDVVRAPKPFPQYGPHCYATFFLDPHGFMIEVVTHEAVADGAEGKRGQPGS